MNCYSKVLLDSIDREKAGLDYICSEQDRTILDKMFTEINTTLNTNFHYIAEIDSFNIPGAGRIMAQYIFKFSSESIRAYLTPQIVSDKVSGVDALVIDLYRKFKSSREYISPPNEPAPAHIYSRYDTAISALKPKKLKMDLLDIVNTPRDVFYLPLTAQMMASWKLKEFEDLLFHCIRDDDLSVKDVGLPEDNRTYYPSFEVIKRQLKFIVVNSLKYYSTRDVLDSLCMIPDNDPDLNMCVKKAISYISKRL